MSLIWRGRSTWVQPNIKRITQSRDEQRQNGPKKADDTIITDFRALTDPASRSLNTQQFRLFVGTWNVGGNAPTKETRESMHEWLIDPLLNQQPPPDIYVLGFQEIVPLNATNILKGNKEDGKSGGMLTSDMWEALISETLNRSSCPTQSMTNAKQSIHSMYMHTSRGIFTTEKTQRSCARDNGNHNSNKNERGSLCSDDTSFYAFTPSVKNPSSDERVSNASTYTRIAKKQMVGLFITIWARQSLRQYIKNVQVSSVGCGIMNRLGNKGSVSISLSLHETSFCFICGHLRSGQRADDVIRRNVDVENILHRTRFPCFEKLNSNFGFPLPSTILAHDRIILLGDLNYRLNIASTELKALLQQQDWEVLFERDELKGAKRAGGVLEGWREGLINFAPTYKYLNNSDTYWSSAKDKEGSKKRAPAWCDRILWYGKGLKQLTYTRCESKHSDHRPVRSIFMVEVEVLENTSIFYNNNVGKQRIVPFLEEVKDLLCTTNSM